MRHLLAVSIITLLTASCAATTTSSTTDVANSKTEQRAIESVIFVKSSPPVSATQRRDQTLTVNKDLSTHFEIKDGYNKVLNEKTGTVTAKQFESLAGKLNTADYTRLKPKKRAQSLVGSPTNKLIVKSYQGAHRFIEGAMTEFPDELADVFAMQTQYVPTTPVAVKPKTVTKTEATDGAMPKDAVAAQE